MAQRDRVEHVALDHLGVGVLAESADELLHARGEVVEDDHFEAVLHKPVRERAADEAGAARHKGAFHRAEATTP
jgi:hypothetical protein